MYEVLIFKRTGGLFMARDGFATLAEAEHFAEAACPPSCRYEIDRY
jgi:hypothetical protein